jgi:small subunit ribosomal protein S1
VIANNSPTEVNNSQPENHHGEDASFADMLDDYVYDMPYRGQILEGVVLEADKDEVLVDVGLKRDAIVTRKDLGLLDDKLRESIVPGKEVVTYVLQPRNDDGDLIVSINKALELEDWTRAKQCIEEDIIVDAEVVSTNRGGLLVRFGRLTGFVPQSHLISLPRFTSADELYDAKKDMIGQMLPLKFIEIDRRRNRLILSERDARMTAQKSRISELEEGQVLRGRVVSIVDFGAFVDIGGVDGLIHISKLDHRHVNHPGEVVAVGDEVDVRVDSIDTAENRISLNRVAVLPNPWDRVAEEYSVDDLIEGTVTNVVDFGVFVELPNGLQGLVHVSRMSSFGISNPRDLVREGDPVLVRIVSVEPERHRIGLSMDDVSVEEQEEWLHRRHQAEPVTADDDEVDPVASESEPDNGSDDENDLAADPAEQQTDEEPANG